MTTDAAPHHVDQEHWWPISVTAMTEADAISAAREIPQTLS
ncbi:MAG TPA: hypothetical protein VHO01_13260 [Jatrophihabitans sp.]|nr:hypothetical protein [Jatrophihabitans sp.]